MNHLRDLAAILAGRWEIPLAICAVTTGGVALYRMKPPERTISFEALRADVSALAEAGEYFDAANAAANLLELEPPLPRAEQAKLHDALADVIYRQELVRGLPNLKNARLLLEHHQAALLRGRTSDAHGALRAGHAREWLGETQPAIDEYRSVLERTPGADERRLALQGLVRLLAGQPQAEEERREYIHALLDEEGVSPSYLWWALQHAVQEALDHDDLLRVRDLLTDHGRRFQRSDLKGYHDYLWAWAYVHDGQTDLAEPLIDRVDQWLDQHARSDLEMDRAGFLPAMNVWLRGCVELAEGRPQAALEHFDQAVALQSHGRLLVGATIGQARAQALLERHSDARETVRDTLARLESDFPTLNSERPRLRQTINELYNQRHALKDHENALRYLELVLELTPTEESALRLETLERLARENEVAATSTVDPDGQRARHAAAARAYEQAAELARFAEPRHAELLWDSAQQFDRAGRAGDSRRMLLRFVEGRSLDPRMPQALLQLGQVHAANGMFLEAIEYYRQLIERFPMLEEAVRARLLTADCLMALGEAHYGQAETALRDLLEDEEVAPEAPVFRDALFELCDLLYQQQRYGPAISHMEDFLVFYPEDPERYRIQFMLADAYRGSAYALLSDETGGTEAARRRVSRERFQRAAELFGVYADNSDSAAISAQSRAPYQRLALFYRGDCLFELNEPASLEEALATYRQLAARYQGTPAALTAQVQIANIHLRQGKLIEAARSVERARWLLGSIPDAAFAEHGDGMDRPAWDRYLSAVRSSHLFEGLIREAQ